jgi:outer membrane protein assembly factor BamB
MKTTQPEKYSSFRRGARAPVVSLALLWSSGAVKADSTWPMERHDVRNTGATALSGKITQPAVWWDAYLGPPRVDRATTDAADAFTLHDLDGDGRPERVHVGGRTVAVRDATGNVLWQYTIDSKTGISPHCTKVARVLPGSKGRQILAASSRMDTGEGYAWCFSFDEGADRGRVVWQTENLTGMHAPEGIVADVDGDGRMEFCLAPHYRVLILDAVTGKINHTVKWDVGRNYGLFAAEDIDGDGCRELLIICDFVLHVDMIDVSPGGRAEHGWSRRFIPGTQFDGARRVYIHAGLNALADLDGDGRWEIWLNLFNHENDGTWHLHIMDARTGKVRCDRPGWYLCGGDDLDGDGRIEIVAIRCTRQRPGRFGQLVVLRFADDRIQEVASLDHVRPVMTNMLPPTHVASNADDRARGVLRSDRRIFAIASRDGQRGDTVLALELTAGRLAERARYACTGADIDVLSLVGQGATARLTVRDVIGAWRQVLDGNLKPIGGRQPDSSPGFVAVPIVADLGGKVNSIIVPNSAGQIVALQHRDSGPPAQIWRAAGRGMTQSSGYSNANRGVVAADVNGDGKVEIICAHRTANGDGTIRVLRRDGTVLWEHAFDRMPVGGLEAGIDLWSVGRFGCKTGKDIWVSVHRCSKGSGESYVLQGNNGQERWNIKTAAADTGHGPKVSRCFGAALPFVVDIDGDGIDEIGMCPYEIYTVTRGSDGNHLIGPTWLLHKDVFGRWLAYFAPTPVDLDSDGRLDVFLNTASCTAGGVAAVTLDGKPKYVHWHDNTTGCGSYQAVADVNGDGWPEIGAAHIDGRFRCYRGADGRALWEHKLPPGGCSHVVAADIDGDGGGEFVFVGPDQVLYALRGTPDAPAGRVVWTLPLGTTGTPIIADINGDASAEILLAGADGRLRAIGQAGRCQTKP